MLHIRGQDRAVDILQSQLRSSRLSHAYIFHGPAGVGKFTTALGFGRIILCRQRQSDLAGRVEACGSCGSCKLLGQVNHDSESDGTSGDKPDVLGNAHPDLHVITKELAHYSDNRQTRDRKLTQIPVEVLRSALLDPVALASKLGHGKLFIVDEAELLNLHGQNLLLKTLEEPPPDTTIILVTASEDRLLPTIRSRCQRVAFVPLDRQVISAWVDRVGCELPAPTRQWLVDFADGSMGKAQLAIDYDLAAWARAVLPAIEQLHQGRGGDGTLGRVIFQCIDTFAQSWVSNHTGASKEAANKLGCGLMWSMLGVVARGKLAELSGQCDADEPAASELRLGPWLGLIDALEESQRLLGSNVNLGLVCDHLVMTIMNYELKNAKTTNFT